jgi:hypothetical protein
MHDLGCRQDLTRVGVHGEKSPAGLLLPIMSLPISEKSSQLRRACARLLAVDSDDTPRHFCDVIVTCNSSTY